MTSGPIKRRNLDTGTYAQREDNVSAQRKCHLQARECWKLLEARERHKTDSFLTALKRKQLWRHPDFRLVASRA